MFHIANRRSYAITTAVPKRATQLPATVSPV